MSRVPLTCPFSHREQQMIELLLEGFEQKQIAKKLGISHATVNATLNRAATKIPGDRLNSEAKLLVWARGGSFEVLTGIGVTIVLTPPR